MPLSIFRRHEDGEHPLRVGFLNRCLSRTMPAASSTPHDSTRVRITQPTSSFPRTAITQMTIGDVTVPWAAYHELSRVRLYPESHWNTSHMSAQSTTTEGVKCNEEPTILSRLPTEIRLLIYQYVFGDHKTNLFFGKATRPRFTHPSENPSMYSNAWSCFSFLNQPGLSLLRTCRQIYLEGLETAVECSVFFLRGPACFNHFSNNCLRAVRPDQLCLINNLDIQWVYCPTRVECVRGHDYPKTESITWAAIWDMISANTKLKNLGLHFVYAGPKEQMHTNASWLMPLRHIWQIRDKKSLKIDIRHFKSLQVVESTLNTDLQNIMTAGEDEAYPLPCQSQNPM